MKCCLQLVSHLQFALGSTSLSKDSLGFPREQSEKGPLLGSSIGGSLGWVRSVGLHFGKEEKVGTRLVFKNICQCITSLLWSKICPSPAAEALSVQEICMLLLPRLTECFEQLP